MSSPKIKQECFEIYCSSHYQERCIGFRRLHKIARKATINFVMSVSPSARPSVLMEKFGSHWKNVRKI